MDVTQSSDSIGHNLISVLQHPSGADPYHGVSVADKIPQSLDEPVFYTQLWFQVEDLGDTQCGGLSDIWVFIFQTSGEGRGKVVENLFRSQNRHRSDG